MLKRGNPLIVEVLSNGIVLYGKKEYEKLTSYYRELLSRGLRKTETSVIVPRVTPKLVTLPEYPYVLHA